MNDLDPHFFVLQLGELVPQGLDRPGRIGFDDERKVLDGPFLLRQELFERPRTAATRQQLGAAACLTHLGHLAGDVDVVVGQDEEFVAGIWHSCQTRHADGH